MGTDEPSANKGDLTREDRLDKSGVVNGSGLVKEVGGEIILSNGLLVSVTD
jgi:hypothetical protein